MDIFSVALILFYITAINGQAGWNPSSMLSRVPGLHHVGGTMAFPQFLAMRMGYSSDRSQQPECPRVSNDCPKDCRKADHRGCRVCNCSEVKSYHSSGSCREPPPSCPESCRKRDDKGCKICSCNKGSSLGSNSYSAVSSSAYKNCYSMITCMLSCHKGYTLGAVINSHGCQTCTCIDDQDKGDKFNSISSGINKAGSSIQNLAEVGNTGGSAWSSNNAAGSDLDGVSAWQNGATESSSTWNSNIKSENGNKNPWGSGVGSGNTGNNGGKDVWSTANGIGDSSSGCSGPLCPGNSGGMNPMFPEANSNTGSSGSGSEACTGPFCAGQGGGMGGMGGAGGGASGCTGPFCTMGGSSAGMGGASGGMMGSSAGMGGASGGMMGSSAGMGGASGGMGGAMGGVMGGSGGVGAFSPFGLASGAGSGNSGGCSGPFCTMAKGGSGSGGGGSTMTSSFDSASLEGKYVDCTGPSCSAKNGEGFQ